MPMTEEWLETQQRQAAELVRGGASYREAMEVWSMAVIHAALNLSGRRGRRINQIAAATMLGVHRNTLHRKL